MKLGVGLGNLLRLVLRLEVCLLQAKACAQAQIYYFQELCSDSGS